MDRYVLGDSQKLGYSVGNQTEQGAFKAQMEGNYADSFI